MNIINMEILHFAHVCVLKGFLRNQLLHQNHLQSENHAGAEEQVMTQ